MVSFLKIPFLAPKSFRGPSGGIFPSKKSPFQRFSDQKNPPTSSFFNFLLLSSLCFCSSRSRRATIVSCLRNRILLFFFFFKRIRNICNCNQISILIIYPNFGNICLLFERCSMICKFRFNSIFYFCKTQFCVSPVRFHSLRSSLEPKSRNRTLSNDNRIWYWKRLLYRISTNSINFW